MLFFSSFSPPPLPYRTNAKSLLVGLQRRCGVALSSTLFVTLIPSFLADALNCERRYRASKLHSTSYLDGLRGLAALTVFAYHYTDYNHKFLLQPYGSNPPEGGSSFLQLPYIRAMYTGAPMVHVFFVISGFSLAYRPLQCLYDKTSTSLTSVSMQSCPSSSGVTKCHLLLASSTFRRPFRLFGPPIVITFFYIPLVPFNLFPGLLVPKPTTMEQVADWFADAI